jgi:hypothetical protein
VLRYLLLLAHLLLLPSIGIATANAVGNAVASATITARLYAGAQALINPD